MAGGLYLYSGFDTEEVFRAHLGHEQVTALVLTLRGVRYKEVLIGCREKLFVQKIPIRKLAYTGATNKVGSL